MTSRIVCLITLLATLPGIASATSAAAPPAEVRAQSTEAPVRYAARCLRAELDDLRIRLDVTISVDSALRAPDGSPAGPQSYRVTRPVTYSAAVVGSDPVGAMYGCFELIERVRSGGELAQPVFGKPSFLHRQHRFRLPYLPATFPVTKPDAEPFWFADEGFWTKYLDTLARDRYNELSIWHRCPFQYLVDLPQYPEASAFAPGEFPKYRAMWSMVFRLAKERGIDVYLGNWNIEVPLAFAKAHGVPAKNSRTPVVAEYTRQSVAALLRTYPDLTGFGTCPGEAMVGLTNREKEQWIWDNIVGGIVASGRKNVPLQHRSWGLGDDYQALEEIVAKRYPGPLFVDMKYNGENMYASTKPHFFDPGWLAKSNHFTVLWHLRNDCIALYPWWNPDFAEALFANAAQGNVNGYLMGSEFESPGPGYPHIPAIEKPWAKYQFEDGGDRLALWGREGYAPAPERPGNWMAPDPDMPRDWMALNRQNPKRAAMAELEQATIDGSAILQAVQGLHFQYLGGWFPESCSGGGNGDEPLGNHYLDSYEFKSVVEWIFHHPVSDDVTSVAERVLKIAAERKRGTWCFPGPPDDEDPGWPEFGGRAHMCRDHAEAAARLAPDDVQVQQTALRLRCLATLGLYYDAKIWGAVELGQVMLVGDRSQRSRAVNDLLRARKHWLELIRLAESPNPTQPSLYRRYLPDVEADIKLARQAVPAPAYYASLKLFDREGHLAPGDLMRVHPIIRGSIPELSAPLNLNPRAGLDPDKYGAIVIGPDADGFDRLDDEVKQRLLRGLAEGQKVVIFDQGPDFRYDWAGGGLHARLRPKSDGPAVARPVGDHPLAQRLASLGVTFALPAGGSVLAPGGGWKALTEPPVIAVRQEERGEIIAVQAGLLGAQGHRRDRETALRELCDYASAGKKLLVIDEGGTATSRKLLRAGAETRSLCEGLSAKLSRHLGRTGRRGIIVLLALLACLAPWLVLRSRAPLLSPVS